MVPILELALLHCLADAEELEVVAALERLSACSAKWSGSPSE